MNAKKISIGVFLTNSLFSTQGFSTPCDMMLNTALKAKACLSWRLNNLGDDLYIKAGNDGHLGDISKCSTSEKNKDYFSNIKSEFLSTIRNVILDNCISADKKWKCWENTSGTKGCYAPNLTNRIFFSIGDGTISTNLITFYPTASN